MAAVSKMESLSNLMTGANGLSAYAQYFRGCDVNGAKDINGQVAAAFVRGCPLHMMRGRSVRRDRVQHVESGASS